MNSLRIRFTCVFFFLVLVFISVLHPFALMCFIHKDYCNNNYYHCLHMLEPRSQEAWLQLTLAEGQASILQG